MDISAQINKLTRERQLLEEQVKDVKSEIKNINIKIRKLETIARHAEDVLGDQVQIKDGPTDFPIGGKFGNVQCESGPIEILSGSRVSNESNGQT